MKYLFRILFVLALFCGVTSHAWANNFHAGLTDPNSCGPNPSACTIIDATGPITGFQFTNGACNSNVPTSGGTPFCIDLFNSTLQDIGLVTLDIPDSALGGLIPVCDTTADFTCAMSGDGSAIFSFSGIFKPGTVEDLYVYAEGNPPGFDITKIDNSATLSVAATPEPDSLLLLSTGVMMAGLYLAKRRNLFAFGNK